MPITHETYPVKIYWVPMENGGRRTIPEAGIYYSVALFPEGSIPQTNAWSVVFRLNNPATENGRYISLGDVRFLMETAPAEILKNIHRFEIYEGPKKVADIERISKC